MTQIVVTLDGNVDSSLLQRMIENMKGVLRTSICDTSSIDSNDADLAQWQDKFRELRSSINPSIIDMDDDSTRYIMSK